MRYLRMQSKPDLKNTLFIGAFSGWNDGSGAAVWAVRHLARLWQAKNFAEITPDPYYDFSSSHPQIKVVNGSLRRVTWPVNRLSHAQTILRASVDAEPAERDVVLGTFEEPQLRWQMFTSDLIELCAACEVREVILLGSIFGRVPHTAPIPLTGVVTSPSFLRRMSPLGVEPATYEGNTGLAGAFQAGLKITDIPSISLWAIAPHYVGASPNLPVAAALLDTFKQLAGSDVDVTNVHAAAETFLEKVSALVHEDPAAEQYVHELEGLNEDVSLAPDSRPNRGDLSGAYRIPTDGGLPSPEQAIADVEEWLRQWRHSDGEPGDSTK